MACDLFVSNGDEVNRAFRQRCQNGDVCVATQAKNMLHFPPLEEVNDVFSNGLAGYVQSIHYATSWPKNSPNSSSSAGRSSGIGRLTQV